MRVHTELGRSEPSALGGMHESSWHRSKVPKAFPLLSLSASRSVMSDSATPWTTQSMGFSRPEYWSGQPFPSPGDLPNPGIELGSPALQADSLPAEPPGKPVLQLPPTKFDQVVSSRRKRPARDACHPSAPRTGPYPRVSPVPVCCPRGGICVPALAS